MARKFFLVIIAAIIVTIAAISVPTDSVDNYRYNEDVDLDDDLDDYALTSTDRKGKLCEYAIFFRSEHN